MQNIDYSIQLVESPSYYRSLRMVEDGLVDTMAESVWLSDINDSLVHVSSPVLAVGDFEKGIYALAGHPLVKGQKTSKLDDYTGVTIKSWKHDWQILNDISDRVVSTLRYDSLVKVLEAGRGDFTLHEFPQGGQLTLDLHGAQMMPIEGVKVIIPESRVLVFSKKRRDDKGLVKSIGHGIRELEKSGEIKRLYRQLGFHNPATEGWQVLNSFQALASK
ncbi:hypothetical protein [Agaribacter flavus]|uniref:Solute-binding protein family 3/N-terminal domain-containing protein n=1 Tax=Agaribacter flavus TaxID=1902781 RepID=A0ABV7FK07_9ALTE